MKKNSFVNQVISDIFELENRGLQKKISKVDGDRVFSILSSIFDKIGIVKGKKLGAGKYGIAYDIGNGVVMKLTADKQEIDVTSQLLNKKLENVAEYYSVFYSRGLKIGILLMKKYYPIDGKESFGSMLLRHYYSRFWLIKNRQDFTLRDALEEIDAYYEDDSDEQKSKYRSYVNSIVSSLKFTKLITKSTFQKFLYYLAVNADDVFIDDSYEEIYKYSAPAYQLMIDSFTAMRSLREFGIDWLDDHIGNFAKDENNRYVAIDIGRANYNGEPGDIIIVEGILW